MYFPELLKESVTCGQKVGCVGEAHSSVISQGKRWPVICLLKWHRLYLKNSGSGTITPPLVFIHIASSTATLLHPHPSYREFSSKCWRAIIENYQHLGSEKWWCDLSPLSPQPWHYQASLALVLTASSLALVLMASHQTIVMAFSLPALILLKQCLKTALPEATHLMFMFQSPQWFPTYNPMRPHALVVSSGVSRTWSHHNFNFVFCYSLSFSLLWSNQNTYYFVLYHVQHLFMPLLMKFPQVTLLLPPSLHPPTSKSIPAFKAQLSAVSSMESSLIYQSNSQTSGAFQLFHTWRMDYLYSWLMYLLFSL